MSRKQNSRPSTAKIIAGSAAAVALPFVGGMGATEGRLVNNADCLLTVGFNNDFNGLIQIEDKLHPDDILSVQDRYGVPAVKQVSVGVRDVDSNGEPDLWPGDQVVLSEVDKQDCVVVGGQVIKLSHPGITPDAGIAEGK